MAQTPKELLDDLHALVADAEKMMSDSIAEHTEDGFGALRERLQSAQDRLSNLYNGARTKVVAGAKLTDQTIRANPYQSIAIAAGVGLLIGALWARRSE